MINEKNIISFVINLDNYEENYKKQLPYFNSINLSPKRFSAVNAINNQHIKHKNLINLISFYLLFYSSLQLFLINKLLILFTVFVVEVINKFGKIACINALIDAIKNNLE